MKYSYIDLFAGCGGLSEGFEKSKIFEGLAFVEWEKYPCETLKKRLEEKWKYKNTNEIVIRFDIQRTKELLNGWENDDNFKSGIGLKKTIGKTKVDLVIGGPPCQAYSIAGRVRDNNKMNDDYRNYLFESYLEVVKSFKPKLIVFENVEGILSAKPGGVSIIDRISASFHKVGYDISTKLREEAMFNVAEYGIPQNRKRIIILGVSMKYYGSNSQKVLNDFYQNIIPSFKVKKKKTVEDSIYDLPKILPLKSPTRKESHKVIQKMNILNHFPRFHSQRDIKIFSELAKDVENGSKNYSDVQSLIELYKKVTGKESKFHKYNVLNRKKPSNTIPAHLYKDGLRHIHPDHEQGRSITVREAARLQTFPDDMEFIGSMGEQYKMIGNAVPPLFSEILSNGITQLLKKYNNVIL
jgi:DNA (cytosine-5)-methyltransferase 1